MDPKKFIEPKEIDIDGSKFILSKIPAIQAQQVYREIMKQTKEDGDVAMTYLTIEPTIELLSYSASVDGDEGSPIWTALENEAKINFACGKVETLIKLEAAMIRYNFGFLFDGTLQNVLEVLRDITPVI